MGGELRVGEGDTRWAAGGELLSRDLNAGCP